MTRLALFLITLSLLVAPYPLRSTPVDRTNSHEANGPANQTPEKKKQEKKAKKQQPKKQTPAKKKAKPAPKQGKKQQPKKKNQKAAPAKAIVKNINGVSVAFPSEPSVRTYDESVTYTVMTTHSALTVMHLRKIKTDGELVYFSPEYKNSERWKQEDMAYQEMKKIATNHLKLPAHWEPKDYKAPLGKRFAATYKVDKPKARRGRIISFLEENGAVVVQAVTMKPGQAGEKERNAFLQSVKPAAQ